MHELKKIVEALLFASEDPLDLGRLHELLISHGEPMELNHLKNIISDLVEDYVNRGIELKEVANGWRFQVKAELGSWVAKLREERPPKYSRALLEILALIAYRQPITRAEIEDIRGVVVSSGIIRTLIDHEWIKIVGVKEVPGRPSLFATTKKFLDHFNLRHLGELPALEKVDEEVMLDGPIKSGHDGAGVGNLKHLDELPSLEKLDGEIIIDETVLEETILEKSGEEEEN